jgi:hypothetical protein
LAAQQQSKPNARIGSRIRNPPLVGCIAIAHPAILEDNEMFAVNVPVQIMAAEHNVSLAKDRRESANKIIPALGVSYDYQYFPWCEARICDEGCSQG